MILKFELLAKDRTFDSMWGPRVVNVFKRKGLDVEAILPKEIKIVKGEEAYVLKEMKGPGDKEYKKLGAYNTMLNKGLYEFKLVRRR